MKSKRRAGKVLSLLLSAALLVSNFALLNASAESAPENEATQHTHVHTYAESGSEEVQREAADITRPVITVTPVNDHVDMDLYYCEPPQVTITDEGENLASVTIKTYSDEKTIEISSGSYELDLSDVEGSVTLTAKDTEGNTEIKRIFIGHLLGGRQSRDYAPNCTQPGRRTMVYTCKICGEPYYQYDTADKNQPAKGHDFAQEVKTADVTKCGGQGSITIKTCNTCGYMELEYSEDYQEGGEHKWEEKTQSPSCYVGGASWEECSECGAVRNVTVLKATSHHFGQWQITKPADCENGTPGVMERSCENGCGVSETTYIAGAHRWSERTTVVEPTCETEGYSGFKCLNCGIEKQPEKYRWKIPALGHDYSDDGNCMTETQCKRCHVVLQGQANHKLGDYKSDGEAHWRECTNKGCNFKTERENHVRPDTVSDCTNTSICTICSAKAGPEYTSHEWKYESDENFHWQSCAHEGCSVTTPKKEHNVKDDHNCETALVCLDCQKVLKPEMEHAYSEKYTYTVGQHWRECTNEGCNSRTELDYHNFAEDYNCTTRVSCIICGYVAISGEMHHNYLESPIYGDDDGHYKQCQNGNCNVTERAGEHSGGTATCVTQAICDECHLHYGPLNPQNHVETEIVKEKPATQTEEGYTGDLVCKGCQTVITPGKVIPKLPEECQHNWKDMVDDTKCWQQCEICGEIQNQKEHELETKSGPEGHWQQCKNCKHQSEVIPHDIDENDIDNDCTTEIDCKVCGYVVTEAYPNHVWGDDLMFDQSEHWRVCTNPGCEQRGEIKEHNPVDDGNCMTAVYCSECKHTLVEAEPEHKWPSVWESDAEGHFKRCENIDCQQIHREEHQRVEDDGNCTTPVVCSVCSYEIEAGAEEHDFSGDYITTDTGHHQKCQNAGCNEVSSETAHSGGEANCKDAAVCVVCGASYGEKNPAKHTGNTEVRGYIEPTTETEGFTGNLVCVDCEAILQSGVILEKLPPEHQHEFNEKLADDTHHWEQCVCGERYNYTEHSFGDYDMDNTHHWHTCLDCEKVVSQDHEFVDGQCSVCGFEMPKHEHTFEWRHDGENHWQECTDCEETRDNGVHTGGEANCKSGPVCETCGSEYGEKNSENHVGGTVIEGRIEPTTEKEGYTGDERCLGCGEIVKKGEAIPKLPIVSDRLGDVNNDGVISIADAILVQKHVVNVVTLEGEDFAAADADKNGEVNIADAIMIQKHIVGILTIE